MELILIISIVILFFLFLFSIKKYKEKHTIYKKQFNFDYEDIKKETVSQYRPTVVKKQESCDDDKMKNEMYRINNNLKSIKSLLTVLVIIAIIFLVKEICSIILLVNLPTIITEAMNTLL